MKSIRIVIVLVLSMTTVNRLSAQKQPTLTANDFRKLEGCWKATLFYNGTMIRKPYTVQADACIKRIGKLNKWQVMHVYSQDAADCSADTISLSVDGRKLNEAKIKSKTTLKNGTTTIVTEAPGVDAERNTAATIRHTYSMAKNSFVCRKQILPAGQSSWQDISEFKYVRKDCVRKKSL